MLINEGIRSSRSFGKMRGLGGWLSGLGLGWRGGGQVGRFACARQPEALGLGHAVLMAKELVGDEPFAVILPDDIVDTKVGCLKQMVEVFEETHSSILGTEVVEGDAISLYGCLDCEPTRPTPACWRSGTWSKSRSRRTRQVRNAIIGRYILTPRIFEMIEQLKPGTCGEVQPDRRDQGTARV